MPPKDKYSDPKLRDEVKQEIHEGDKGGAPGQWSARKAQMMASEYKKRGGGYNTNKSEQDESQKHLSKWSEEDWQTKEGSGNAKQDDGTEKRYLPKKAWENMTEEEKEATEEKKQEGSKDGKQHVQNTGKAKDSRKKANEEEDKKYESRKAGKKENMQQDGKEKQQDSEENEVDENDAEDDAEEYEDDGEASDAEDDEGDESEDQGDEDEGRDDAKAGQKRKGGSQNQANGGSKKQKSEGDTGNAPKGKVGSKHMVAEEPAPRGSSDRLPKKGQKITWKAMPGYVDGEVTEILTSGKKVDGKDVKASKSDPRIVMKSEKSGKICVHKPDATFYD